ncbi:hypothetical protein ACFU99_24245 [Streptomyces sp. NPDC057654]|uniref:hypothetical protein n=1 Tax=Streptomyces sp. NPDC057654 TaxID=3346196 RepID=UPI0036A39213
MMPVIGRLLGYAATLLALVILRRGYVQDRRRERLRGIRPGRLVEEPRPGGEAHLFDQENCPVIGSRRMNTESITAAAAFTLALAKLAEEYPTDPEDTPLVTVTVTNPATGEQHQVSTQPGQLDWVTALVRDELDTVRNAHCDGSGYCGHCRGNGLAHGTGGAALAELPADDGSRP